MRLYLDLDGVMADFDGGFEKNFGTHPRKISDEVLWSNINSMPTFFSSLSLCEGAKEFFDDVSFMNVTILTACPKTNYKEAALQKKEWVRKNLSEDVTILPVLGGKNKALFMHQPGDVLIDDFQDNCDAWDEMDGISIRHKDFKTTRRLLTLIVGKAFS